MSLAATSALHRYRPLFVAAAIYNLVWGLYVALFPAHLLGLLRIDLPQPLAIWQVVGMCVLVYAPGYAWIASDPVRFRHYVLIGFLGKVLGPIGFIWAAASGALPWRFGWINVTNDLIWLPGFVAFMFASAEVSGGWRNFLRGR